MARVLSIGHRGAAGHAPENTLAAVQKAIELGADFVEIDVRRTADDALVALHDPTVNRTTNGKGRIDSLSLEELRTFDAGNGERIPTVEEVLKIAAGRVGLMLELKVAGVAHLTVQVVRKVRFEHPVIYASFLHHELTNVRTAAPEAMLMMLFDKLPRTPVAYAMQYRPHYVGLRHDRANRRLVETFHGENVQVWVYTANRPGHIRRVLSFGVDGVISNFPERIRTSSSLIWPE
jgi:glycerophosphoryl diester phosphodiesterase